MIQEVLEKYFEIFPEDKPALRLLFKQVTDGDDLSDRKNYIGHITGGAVVFSPNHKKILLVDHPTLERWLQPGGHWDLPETGPWETAEREVIEETGVKLGKRINATHDLRIPILIDSHLIPTRPPKNEPEHFHHDFKYVFIASSEKLSMNDDVIKIAKWVSLGDSRIDKILKTTIERAQPLLNG